MEPCRRLSQAAHRITAPTIHSRQNPSHRINTHQPQYAAADRTANSCPEDMQGREYRCPSPAFSTEEAEAKAHVDRSGSVRTERAAQHRNDEAEDDERHWWPMDGSDAAALAGRLDECVATALRAVAPAVAARVVATPPIAVVTGDRGPAGARIVIGVESASTSALCPVAVRGVPIGAIAKAWWAAEAAAGEGSLGEGLPSSDRRR